MYESCSESYFTAKYIFKYLEKYVKIRTFQKDNKYSTALVWDAGGWPSIESGWVFVFTNKHSELLLCDRYNITELMHPGN
jgi:hypothetical protein